MARWILFVDRVVLPFIKVIKHTARWSHKTHWHIRDDPFSLLHPIDRMSVGTLSFPQIGSSRNPPFILVVLTEGHPPTSAVEQNKDNQSNNARPPLHQRLRRPGEEGCSINKSPLLSASKRRSSTKGQLSLSGCPNSLIFGQWIPEAVLHKKECKYANTKLCLVEDFLKWTRNDRSGEWVSLIESSMDTAAAASRCHIVREIIPKRPK